jgi:elongin-C
MNQDDSSKELQFVKLVSAEGSEFYIDRRVAMSASKTIRTMLEGQFREAQDNVVKFPEISNYILERVLQYLYYQSRVSLRKRCCFVL